MTASPVSSPSEATSPEALNRALRAAINSVRQFCEIDAPQNKMPRPCADCTNVMDLLGWLVSALPSLLAAKEDADNLRIAAAKVLYRVGEWMPDVQRQAFGEDTVATDFGSALSELRTVANVVRDEHGYPMVNLDAARVAARASGD